MSRKIPQQPEVAVEQARQTATPVFLKRPVRWLLIAVGFVCVGLGAAGTVVPLLPTTPFLLVAAACFGRSSPRFYRWLLARPGVGSAIREWRETRTITRRVKTVAVLSIVLVGGSSILFFVNNPWAKLVMCLGLLAVIAWLLSIPSRPPTGTRIDSNRTASNRNTRTRG